MTKQANGRAHLEMEVNLLAEQELTAIRQMLYTLCLRPGHARVNDERVLSLLQDNDFVQSSSYSTINCETTTRT
jgi:uncharacterized membrane protein